MLHNVYISQCETCFSATKKTAGSGLNRLYKFCAGHEICNCYTMGCPPVRGDNPRALASGLSYVHVDKHGITILYHQHQCRPCTSRDMSRAKVGKGGIKLGSLLPRIYSITNTKH